uniref:Uncharacterized protein n=1 Tax=Arundo donax TaxID=35708 RepID=A0A0A9CIB9_ARUDO
MASNSLLVSLHSKRRPPYLLCFFFNFFSVVHFKRLFWAMYYCIDSINYWKRDSL